VSTDHTIDWFLLERYFVGTVTPAERAQVEHWLAASPGRQDTAQRVRAALQARGRRGQRDWRRAEAIGAVLARVREGSSEQVITALPRWPVADGGSATARLAQMLRHWFEGATELAAAMLLDANEEPLSEEETKALRDRINDSKRERS